MEKVIEKMEEDTSAYTVLNALEALPPLMQQVLLAKDSKVDVYYPSIKVSEDKTKLSSVDQRRLFYMLRDKKVKACPIDYGKYEVRWNNIDDMEDYKISEKIGWDYSQK